MIGSPFSLQSAMLPRFVSKPRFGADKKPPAEDATAGEKAEPKAAPKKVEAPEIGKDTVSLEASKTTGDKTAEAPAHVFESSRPAEHAEASESASKADGPDAPKETTPPADHQPTDPISGKKDWKYWAKSIALSGVSLMMLAASLGFLALPGGFIVSTGLALGAFLLHDYTTHVSRKTGLLNITDPERLKMLILERGQRPLELLSRLRYPFNPDKQKLWVNGKLHRVYNFDPHKQLSRTGLDYQSVIDKMKAETSYVSKAFILGRFLFTAVLKRGLFRFMQSRGRFVAWLVPLIWSWVTGNKHGRIDDPPPQPPQAVTPVYPLKTQPNPG